jgi:DNA replication and repair protein RecF
LGKLILFGFKRIGTFEEYSMWLKNITLLNFKNYADASVAFSQTVNAFVGDNGAGKTNLLDAIHYLCLCKGYFNPIDTQQIKTGEDLFLIQGDFERDEKNEKITCGVKRNQKKQFKRNKKEYDKLADHIGLFPLVMISPYDASIIIEGSEERRRFMDNVISQTDARYLDELIIYNKHLLNRNAFLKQVAINRRYDPTLFEIIDAQLVASGNKIFEKRKQFILDFIPLFNQHYAFLSNSSEQVNLEYLSQLNDSLFESLLGQSVEKDKILERTTTGIHKDDLIFSIRDMPLKKFGSQGQQKSFLIALKLAQYSYLQKYKGFKPLLLLDDIFDKLDDNRVHKLMEMVSHHDFGQIFITDTGRERVLNIFNRIQVPVTLFVVNNGSINHA